MKSIITVLLFLISISTVVSPGTQNDVSSPNDTPPAQKSGHKTPGTARLTVNRVDEVRNSQGNSKQSNSLEAAVRSVRNGAHKVSKMIKSHFHHNEFVFNVGSWESPEHTWNEQDFKKEEKIGGGSFGEVWLVVWKSKDTLALKEIKKQKLMKAGTKEIDSAQKKRAENPKKKISSQSLYILMEYAPYDLYNLTLSIKDSMTLNKERKQHCVGCVMSDDEMKNYLAALVSALEQMHALGLAYCDLKDENILIDREGRIKISDFGFVWKLKKGEKATIPVGTMEFMAPEIVNKRLNSSAPGFDEKVDIWALGALAYSLRTGRTPFGTEKTKAAKAALQQNILNNGVCWLFLRYSLLELSLHPTRK
ncbi:protein kinase domain-containing protein [Ditylenchus destructor]|nr:protein kinase domain-containing protein [Ditylenchus destructor]